MEKVSGRPVSLKVTVWFCCQQKKIIAVMFM